MNLGTFLGFLIGIGGIIFGNLMEGGHFNSLIQGAAAIIVFAGTFGAVLVSSRLSDVKLGLSLFPEIFSEESETREKKIFNEIMDCSRLARKESLVSLESKSAALSEKFLSSVMRTVADGVEPEILRNVFEKQIEIEEKRLNNAIKIYSDAGGFAPTIGIIGAVLGLIHVMGNLSDTSKLGAGIAVAFVATIYGVGSSNLIFLPVGNRLKKIVERKIETMEMILDGGEAILRGLSSSLVDLKIRAYLEATNESSKKT